MRGKKRKPNLSQESNRGGGLPGSQVRLECLDLVRMPARMGDVREQNILEVVLTHISAELD